MNLAEFRKQNTVEVELPQSGLTVTLRAFDMATLLIKYPLSPAAMAKAKEVQALSKSGLSDEAIGEQIGDELAADYYAFGCALICCAAVEPRFVMDEHLASGQAAWVGELPTADRVFLAARAMEVQGLGEGVAATVAPFRDAGTTG